MREHQDCGVLVGGFDRTAACSFEIPNAQAAVFVHSHRLPPEKMSAKRLDRPHLSVVDNAVAHVVLDREKLKL